MLKKISFIFVSIFYFFNSFSQPFGNEWINYNQQYFKFQVYKEGIYRIDYYTLMNSGIPVDNLIPSSLQIFGRGQEQYIYIKGGDDGAFNTSDYIEFYAYKNTGWFDTQLYKTIQNQANPEVSLFTDTAYYFLTWNTSSNNRRIVLENDQNFGNYSALLYFYKISRENYQNKYFKGETNSNGVTDPEYTAGEGYYDSDGFSLNGSTLIKSIKTTNVYKLNTFTDIEFSVIGASNYILASPNHHINVNFANISFDTIYNGYCIVPFKYTIPSYNLDNNATIFNFQVNSGESEGADLNTIAYISVKYPHNTNLEGDSVFKMIIPETSQQKSYLKVNNFSTNGTDEIWIYDITNHKKIKVFNINGYLNALITNSGSEKTCFLYSDKQAYYVSGLLPVSTISGEYAKFIDYSQYNGDYLIITHPLLFSEVTNYADYRNTTGYTSVIADVEQLYDQFSYGIRKNPLAIKNFIRFALDKFTLKPKFLFLVGKSYTAELYKYNSVYSKNSLVPTFGNPPSDILFSAGISDTLYAPELATGRLAAATPSQVAIYLDKVKAYERAQNQPQEWMKNVLHFGGGSSTGEQTEFASYLNNYKNVVQDTFLGNYVRTFLKTSSEPIQINQSDSLRNIINNGVSIMTFFGHASGATFDQSIDYPSEYQNEGKYPFIIANSCFAGDIFGTDELTQSKTFIFTEKKGAIGFLAAVTKSGSYELNYYASELFKNIAYKNYRKPIGESIKNTIKNIQSSNSYIKLVCLDDIYHGDPALIVNSQPKPDYQISTSNIYSTPAEITNLVDTFNLNVIITNIGKAIRDSIYLEIIRTFADGQTKNITYKKIPTTLYKDTIKIKFPVDKEKGIGKNLFTINVDATNQIDELNKTNNSSNIDILIKSTDIYPIYPYKGSIVSNKNITLKASTNDVFSGILQYQFEIDTTENFNSSIKKSTIISQSGGVVEWNPQIILEENKVYFWRVGTISSTNSIKWKESSFQYKQNSTGWGQSNFSQFKDDYFSFIKYDKLNRNFKFDSIVSALNCRISLIYPQYYMINSTVMDYGACTGTPSIHVAIIDSLTLEPWTNETYYFGNANPFGSCRSRPEKYFIFRTLNTSQQDNMRKMIQQVPKGNYILIYSVYGGTYQSWNDSLLRVMDTLGSKIIRGLPNNQLYIFFAQKGYPNSAKEVNGIQSLPDIVLNADLKSNWYFGTITSPIIGPSKKWKSVNWNQISPYKSKNDSVSLKIIGIDKTGKDSVFFNGILPDNTDINIENTINANQYPFLKLIFFTRNDSTRYPNQLKNWQVFYEPYAEMAINPAKYYYFHKDTLTQGDFMRFATSIDNTSDYKFDTLDIKYNIIDENRVIHNISNNKYVNISGNTSIIDSVKYSTNDLTGKNKLWIEINPENKYPEQYSFNNSGEIEFNVAKDRANPLLEVTFDGIHILNGDIVSAKPVINISLSDENKFLGLQDTSLFRIYIKYPNSNTSNRIYFTENQKENIVFKPAVLPDNKCKVEMRPIFADDGLYELTVQAEDASGNNSGKNDYKIKFEVINKSTITNVMNWPNPFSTHTKFIFTLTGSEIPSLFVIQIITITGKVVKEIKTDEIGLIHIGRNITQYSWNGTDDYGDKLANGVYLYRIITNINGKEIEKRKTSADSYFKHDFGKLVIIR